MTTDDLFLLDSLTEFAEQNATGTDSTAILHVWDRIRKLAPVGFEREGRRLHDDESLSYARIGAPLGLSSSHAQHRIDPSYRESNTARARAGMARLREMAATR